LVFFAGAVDLGVCAVPGDELNGVDVVVVGPDVNDDDGVFAIYLEGKGAAKKPGAFVLICVLRVPSFSLAAIVAIVGVVVMVMVMAMVMVLVLVLVLEVNSHDGVCSSQRSTGLNVDASQAAIGLNS